ncbi:M20/M25/M40 family metallo-hydrolase [Actinomycetospora straminea]|uniref:M20/M25/M40 family metallo-hydrolase n=1 Tax=Actinomycetospora straminea TaxID=663607 RepID=UPI0023653CC2|nr:M20/M25/M40 family metallo-hydrolase [Actinomycetospora straminea]MDD7933947.1 M20/M25/M40 family metallo-hydrolase [Actinomycetospora straminea]
MIGRLLAVVLLAVVGAYAVLLERPPDPVPASAPPAEFSADRAAGTVDQLAREPRPVGSPASDAARDALVGRLRAEGLDPRVDATAAIAAEQGQARAARVENVVATLPGTDPTGAVVLMAHYDSVTAGPGAADDMSGVATVLETVRALRAGPPLRNDVTVVLTDGEEAGLLGARAWVREQLLGPLGDRPTVVLNWEARGVEGPSLLFETSPGNAGLVDAWARSVPHPRGDSSLVEVYRFLPNDTDLSPVLDAGRPGMNAAFIERPYQYHTPGDTPANLSRASVQNHGGNALALTRALGAEDLAPLDPVASGREPTGDRTYFAALGYLVTYDSSWAWGVAGLALLLVVVLVVVARVRRQATIGGVLGGLAVYLLTLGVAVAAGIGFWRALVWFRPSYADTGPFLGRPTLYDVAAGILAFVVVTLVVSLLRRRPGGLAFACGALLVLALLSLGLAAVAPGSVFLLAWPVVGLAVGLLVVALAGERPWLAVPFFVLGAVPAVALLVPFAVASYGVAGVSDGLAVAVFVLVGVPIAAGLSALPSPGQVRGYALPIMALFWVLILAAGGLFVDRPDARTPQGSSLAYVLDADAGVARWVTADEAPADWTRRYAPDPPSVVEAWPYGEPVGSGPAPVRPAPGPAALPSPIPGGVRLLVSSPRGAPTIFVRADRPATAVTVAYPGRPPVSMPLDGGPLRLELDDVPPEGAVVDLQLAGPATLRVDDQTLGLAGVPDISPRPPELRQARGNQSDVVVVSRRLAVS